MWIDSAERDLASVYDLAPSESPEYSCARLCLASPRRRLLANCLWGLSLRQPPPLEASTLWPARQVQGCAGSSRAPPGPAQPRLALLQLAPALSDQLARRAARRLVLRALRDFKAGSKARLQMLAAHWNSGALGSEACG